MAIPRDAADEPRTSGQVSTQDTMVWPFSSTSHPPAPEAPKEPDYTIRMPEQIDQSTEAVAARRRKIWEAVQENCALDQAAYVECQQQWNIWSKLTLCQHFQHRYYDCQKAQRVSSSPLDDLSCRYFLSKWDTELKEIRKLMIS